MKYLQVIEIINNMEKKIIESRLITYTKTYNDKSIM